MKIFYRPATHPIHFAADSPDKIIAALRGRYFSFSQSTECRQCKEKHGFPAGVQKVCKSVQDSRKRKIPRGILVRLRELESLAL
jgi:hypothetical protein